MSICGNVLSLHGALSVPERCRKMHYIMGYFLNKNKQRHKIQAKFQLFLLIQTKQKTPGIVTSIQIPV